MSSVYKEKVDELHRRLLSISPPSSDGFSDVAAWLYQIKHVFTVWSGAIIEKPLNAHLESLPRNSLEEKQALSCWVNSLLREFGLAVKCPKTNKPANLRAYIGGQPGVGRFQLRLLENPELRPLSRSDIFEIELIPDSTGESMPTEAWRARIEKPHPSDQDRSSHRGRRN